MGIGQINRLWALVARSSVCPVCANRLWALIGHWLQGVLCALCVPGGQSEPSGGADGGPRGEPAPAARPALRRAGGDQEDDEQKRFL